jgi:ABC-2 type transport system permease protein
LFYSFVSGITDFLINFDKNSLFYQCATNILVGQDVLINYLIFIGALIGLFGLVTLSSMPLYFSLASSSRELSNKKKRSSVNKVSKSTFLTFFKKEWLLSIRDFGEFINNYIFMFATPYVLFVMVGFYSSIDLNELGVYMAVVFSAFVALVMSSASNTSSALAITKEGSEFVLLKTVPADASKMVWAKIFFNLIFSTIMIIVSFSLVIIFGPMLDKGQNGIEWKWLLNNDWLWLMMVATIIINAAMIFWSLQIDIMNPKLREYASSGDVSGMNNASKSIMIGLIVSVLFTVISLLVLLDGSNMVVNWCIILGICVAFFAARLYLFISHLKHVFPYIEY